MKTYVVYQDGLFEGLEYLPDDWAVEEYDNMIFMVEWGPSE